MLVRDNAVPAGATIRTLDDAEYVDALFGSACKHLMALQESVSDDNQEAAILHAGEVLDVIGTLYELLQLDPDKVFDVLEFREANEGTYENRTWVD